MLNPIAALVGGTLLLIWHRNNNSNSVVDGGKISSSYLKYRGKRTGDALHKYGEDIYHLGLDIKAKKNAKVRSVNDGEVLAIWPNGRVSGYGNTVVVKNIDGTGALYAHLNKFANGLNVGSKVNKGQVIGYVGQTQAPRAEMKTAPHLHLEIHKVATVRVNPRYPIRLNPLNYLARQGMTIG